MKIRIGIESTWPAMSDCVRVIWKNFESPKVGIGYYLFISYSTSIRMAPMIILTNKNLNRHLFNPTAMSDHVRVIQKNFKWPKVGIGCHLFILYSTSIRMASTIILTNENPNRHLFNPTIMSDCVRVIQKNFE